MDAWVSLWAGKRQISLCILLCCIVLLVTHKGIVGLMDL